VKFRLGIAIHLIVAIGTICALLASHVSAGIAPMITTAGLLLPAFIIANFLISIWWLFQNKLMLLLSVVLFLVSLPAIRQLINISFHDKPESAKQQITLASFNANFSKLLIPETTDNNESNVEIFADAFKPYSDVDILCIQEIGWRTKSFLEKSIDLPYQHEHEDYTLTIYSKYPILEAGIIKLNSNSANSCIWADIVISPDTLRVYNAHLESNRFDGIVPAMINQDAPESMSLSVAFGLLSHYPFYSAIRTSQAHLIQSHRKASHHKSIIAGDFNDVPNSHMYQTLKDDMVDSYVEEGSGIGATYMYPFSFLRIDHILVDKGINVLNYKSVKTEVSDHLLIMTGLEF